MNKVYFYGALKEKYGGPYEVSMRQPVMAIKFLSAQLPGLQNDIRNGQFKVVSGKLELSEEMLGLPIQGELHVIPVLEGSGGKGGKIILGIALIGIGFFAAPAIVGAMGPTMGMGTTAFSVFGQGVTFGRIAMTGVALTISGVASLLAPSAKSNYGNRERPEARASFLLNGAVNTVEQGTPVPLCYGKFLVGSKVGSAELDTAQI